MCCTVYAETCILCTNPLTPRTTEGDMDANTVAINFVWTLVAGFLVMFMQAGFALVETGFTRAKNAAHTMTMNFMVYGIAMLAYWAVGFALQAGGVGPLGTLGGYDQLSHEVSVTIGGKTWGLFGGTGFFLTGVAYPAPVFAYFLFPMGFMDTAGTNPHGGVACASGSLRRTRCWLGRREGLPRCSTCGANTASPIPRCLRTGRSPDSSPSPRRVPS